jgi:hypothetical protein
MPLQPGPFLQGTKADVTVQPGVYDFTDDALNVGSELNGITDGWNPFILDLGNLATEIIDPTLGLDDAVLIQALANQQQIATMPIIDSIVAALDATDTLFIAAIGFAPAAAWSDPTAPFTPPDPTQTLVVPTVPIGEYNPLINGVVGGPVGPQLPSVSLSNVTRVGSIGFTVGDTFLVTVNGTPGQVITADGTLNGVPLGTTTMGTINTQGAWALSGVEGPDAVGAWLQNWYVDGKLVMTFNFIVSPS